MRLENHGRSSKEIRNRLQVGVVRFRSSLTHNGHDRHASGLAAGQKALDAQCSTNTYQLIGSTVNVLECKDLILMYTAFNFILDLLESFFRMCSRQRFPAKAFSILIPTQHSGNSSTQAVLWIVSRLNSSIEPLSL